MDEFEVNVCEQCYPSEERVIDIAVEGVIDSY